MKKTPLILALGTLVAFGAVAGARMGPGGHHFGMDMDGPGPGMMMLPRLFASVMTDAQRTQLRDKMHADHGKIRDDMKAVRDAHEALEARLLGPGTLTFDALKPDVDRVEAARRQVMEDGLRAMLDVRAMLTPEQLQQANQTHARLRQLQEEMRSLLGPPPTPPAE